MKFLNIDDLDLVKRLQLEDEFFSQPYTMSYSGLNKLLYSPGAFYQHYILKQRDDIDSKAAVEGSLVHCMLLRPESFDEQFVILPSSFPSDNPKKIIDTLFRMMQIDKIEFDYKMSTSISNLEYVEAAMLDVLKEQNLYQSLKTDQQRLDKMLTENNMQYLSFLFECEGKSIVDKEMVAFASKVKTEFANNPNIRVLMGMNDQFDGTLEVFNEVEYATFIDDYSFAIRGIIDNLVIDHENKVIRVNDIKKIGKSLSTFSESMDSYNYWLQAAMYIKIVNHIKKTTLKVDYPVQFRFLVVDKYMQIAPVRISEETMTKYMEMTDDALTVAEYHFKNKDFSLPHSVLMSENREYVL